MSDHGHFSSYEGYERNGERERFVGLFQGCTRFGRLDAGSRAGFTSSRSPPPWTSVFQFSYFCTMCGLEKLGLVNLNWLERNFPVFLLRTLFVGRRQHSESIEVALDLE